MNIKRAKEEIPNTVRADLSKDELGAWRIPPGLPEYRLCIPPAPGPPSPAAQGRYSACGGFFSAGL